MCKFCFFFKITFHKKFHRLKRNRIIYFSIHDKKVWLCFTTIHLTLIIYALIIKDIEFGTTEFVVKLVFLVDF